MPNDNHDAYKPVEIAALIETAGVAKAALPLHRLLTLAMLAGAFIGFGAAFSFIWPGPIRPLVRRGSLGAWCSRWG